VCEELKNRSIRASAVIAISSYEETLADECREGQGAWPSELSRARSLRLSERSVRPFYEKGARWQSPGKYADAEGRKLGSAGGQGRANR